MLCGTEVPTAELESRKAKRRRDNIMSQPKNSPSLNPASFAFTSFNPASFGPTNFSPASGGLIDFLRESTEAALDLSKNLTSAHLPDEFFNVWTRFAEAQFAAAQKYAYQFTAQTLPNMERPEATKSSAAAASTASDLATSKAQENAALVSELEDDIEALKSKLAVLTDKLTALESRPLKIKFSFGEPPHTGWTPLKVVVLGNDAEGHLVELPSTIEPGGFRYSGTPSFWIAIG
jgi:hypothetical protein